MSSSSSSSRNVKPDFSDSANPNNTIGKVLGYTKVVLGNDPEIIGRIFFSEKCLGYSKREYLGHDNLLSENVFVDIDSYAKDNIRRNLEHGKRMMKNHEDHYIYGINLMNQFVKEIYAGINLPNLKKLRNTRLGPYSGLEKKKNSDEIIRSLKEKYLCRPDYKCYDIYRKIIYLLKNSSGFNNPHYDDDGLSDLTVEGNKIVEAIKNLPNAYEVPKYTEEELTDFYYLYDENFLYNIALLFPEVFMDYDPQNYSTFVSLYGEQSCGIENFNFFNYLKDKKIECLLQGIRPTVFICNSQSYRSREKYYEVGEKERRIIYRLDEEDIRNPKIGSVDGYSSRCDLYFIPKTREELMEILEERQSTRFFVVGALDDYEITCSFFSDPEIDFYSNENLEFYKQNGYALRSCSYYKE